MQKQEKRIVAVLTDLFFSVKISDGAKRTGMALEYVKDAATVLEKAKEKPTLMIFDLNYESVDPVGLIRQIKSDPETKRVNCIGYLSHLQGELKQQAQEAGCDMVMARSAFSQNLPLILKRHSGTL